MNEYCKNAMTMNDKYMRALDEKSKENEDTVNHPSHYQHGIEPIEFIESHDFNFNLGNVIKYISRAPYKGTELEDLKKAKRYLEREIERMERND
jgi:hypothetical protein